MHILGGGAEQVEWELRDLLRNYTTLLVEQGGNASLLAPARSAPSRGRGTLAACIEASRAQRHGDFLSMCKGLWLVAWREGAHCHRSVAVAAAKALWGEIAGRGAPKGCGER
ncbi:unnamed protein product, partial [Prorocentrum cordatum]